MSWFKKITESSWRMHLLTAGILVVIAALIELSMGRIPICKCGYVSLWYGNTYGSGNSQHLSDWYTLSHIIHGMLFYGFLWLVARRLPVRTRLVLAVLLECAWEVWENSPFIIDRYRSITAALDYVGDSVINSVSDILAAAGGFFLAYKLPTWFTIFLIIAMEVLAAWVVRDNLTLNIIMLIYPVEAIKNWQLSAPFVPPSLKI